MKRRQFLGSIAGAAAAWPLAVRAQSANHARRIGVLMNGSTAQPVASENLRFFIESLRGLGWIESQNLHVDYRWGGEDGAGFEPGAADLVSLAPDAILAATTPALAAVRRRTGTIPIVFVVVADPVGQGFVSNLARPGGNMTGFSNYDAPMAGKWLGILKDIAPDLTRVALLFNPSMAPYGPLLQRSLESAALGTGLSVEASAVRDMTDIDDAFATLGHKPGSGMIVLPDSFTVANRERIIADAAHHGVPVIYPYKYFVQLGGLVSYGIVVGDLFKRAAPYIDRILKGATPSELPVQSPAQFEFAINLKTAKGLGLTVPNPLLHLADEVIE